MNTLILSKLTIDFAKVDNMGILHIYIGIWFLLQLETVLFMKDEKKSDKLKQCLYGVK